MSAYDPDANSKGCFDLAISSLRERLVKSRVVIGDAVLYCEDAQFILPTLMKVDAIITDPPYHGVKADKWDNQWKTDADFLRWTAETAQTFKRLLADNGSLYWFASPQMAARVEVEIRRIFRVLNHIIWDKSESRKGAAGTGIDVTALRCFWSANTERLIFAEQISSDQVAADASGYYSSCERAKASIFGDYLRSEFSRADVTNKQIAALFPSKTGRLTGCVHNWLLGLNVPTKEQYHIIRDFLNKKCDDDFLRREYEELRREYEELRRPFFVSTIDEWGDIWRFKIDRDQVHPTQKPLALMRHIVKSSTRCGGLVLDPFMGSGTTGVAAIKLGRKFIGIERERKYFDIACRRIEEAYKQGDLFVAPPEAKPEQMSLLKESAS